MLQLQSTTKRDEMNWKQNKETKQEPKQLLWPRRRRESLSTTLRSVLGHVVVSFQKHATCFFVHSRIRVLGRRNTQICDVVLHSFVSLVASRCSRVGVFFFVQLRDSSKSCGVQTLQHLDELVQMLQHSHDGKHTRILDVGHSSQIQSLASGLVATQVSQSCVSKVTKELRLVNALVTVQTVLDGDFKMCNS